MTHVFLIELASGQRTTVTVEKPTKPQAEEELRATYRPKEIIAYRAY